MNHPTKELSLFPLITISITAVLSLSSISYMATIGLQSIFFFVLAAVMFFVPSALVSAELGAMLTEDNGGIYTWVSNAFGKNTGLVAIWMEWFNNVICFPSGLAALVATFAYVGFPALATEPYTMFTLMLVTLWGISLFNCLPIGKVAILNIIGATLGMILPGSLLIICGIYWLIFGNVQIHMTSIHDIIPSFSFVTFALFVKVLSSYSGIQAVSFHARNIINPKKNIPLSMIIALLVIFLLTTLATVSLASIVPASELSVFNGLIQGISVVLNKFHLHLLAQIITVCICVGLISMTSTWILGPARAVQEVATRGQAPQFMAKINKHGMPVNVLLIQAIIASILATSFIILPTIEQAFAMIIALTSQFTVVMWVMVFVSAIKLRYSAKHLERPFRVGKRGNLAMIIWSSSGIIACGGGFFLGLFPPKFSHVTNISSYVTLMIIADVIIITIPFLYLIFRQNKN